MARRTNDESLKYWGGVVREHRASGLSIRQFCEERKIVQTQFYKWRKRLAEPATLQTQPVAPFLPVSLVDAPSAVDGSQIEIRIDGSVSVLVRTGFDADTLCRSFERCGRASTLKPHNVEPSSQRACFRIHRTRGHAPWV